MEEKTYYQDEKVLVTQARFVTNGKTYAIRNISSVQLAKIERSNGWFFGLLLIVCLLIIFSVNDWGWKTGGIVVGIIAALGVMGSKPEYSVRISSNSGESDGLISPDKAYIESIIKAINEAIISYSSSQHQPPPST